ncbi:serine/threonine-protein kinase pdik1l-B-like [Tachysurus vachellii]|uniref:serine/threonine-protein kinase pdik1l-B-like n=1 Tax=Tachysurus vachellii TaxID=175792 RepID=UPI00296ACDC6|nr:serine/threonine-protein kinase pdik1l-B-like [Tachysurus vachellii]XP_060722836.1 serine/threonine-protein kinase pdik1l-B-like [Tachysurus vachellii]XP_060722837.1 serine/threonine-protein kinase pdik1l-B-like [Tachysurus vachellii]
MEQVYRLQREVGRGSYGVVFEGHVMETGWWGCRGDTVAIKRLPCGSPESIQLYLQELWAMRATGRRHPNIIALLNCLVQTGPKTLQPLKSDKLPLDLVESALKGRVVDKDSKSQARNTGSAKRCLALWLVMEYCDGGDLNQYMLSRCPDMQRNYEVVRQLSSGMTFLHGLGIVHRDLKPANVLVCVTKTGPVIKIADFGLSKMVEGPTEGERSRLALSSTCGSDFYMAPEVWAGHSYTAQADIFSLGVLFWAVLERITFLEDGSSEEQLGVYVEKGRRIMPLGEALCQNPALQLVIPMRARRASPLPPTLSPDLCALLLDMLAFDPDTRPTALQLQDRTYSAIDTP